MRTPPKLKRKCANAVFFAEISILIMEISAVTVVPRLAPIKIGMALPKLKRPCWVKIMASPVVTELDWTMAVIKLPASTPKKGLWGCVRKSINLASFWRGVKEEEIKLRLKNTKPK